MNRIYLAAMAALLTLTACGGGGGGGGGAIDTTGGNDNTGGIDGRGTPVFAQGTITGFGSIIVNGVEYETNGSEFEIDGEVGSEAELEIGDVVVISGTISDDGITGTATTVTFDDVVEGPVTAVDANTGLITVLGQTVQVSADTSFDDNISPASIDGISGGDIIEVSGFRLSDGTISATRIEGKPAGGEFEVTGVVSGLSGTSFAIESLTVDFSSAASLDNFPNGSPENGQPVEAKGTLGVNGELVARRVEYKGNVLAGAAGNRVELEGFITRFGSADDFDVSGLPVTTTGATVIEGTGPLGQNLKVEVEGEVNDAGVIVAVKIEIKTATAIRVTGVIDSVPPSAPLAVLGITINADDLKTRFEDKAGDNPLDNMKLADLQVGDYVEIRGQEQPQGQITALILIRDDLDTRTELRGFVETGGKNEPNLTVLGVTVATDGGTVYRDSRGGTDVPMDPALFWATVKEGSLVDVRGTEADVTTLTATEVELQME